MLVADTEHSLSGRHSMRLQLPGGQVGRLWAGDTEPHGGALPVPLSLGPGSGCGEGWQGLRLQPNRTYNISVWARSDYTMKLSLASGLWVGSVLSKLWEYYTCGGPNRTMVNTSGTCTLGMGALATIELTAQWRQLTAIRHKSADDVSPECLQLLASGRGSMHIDYGFVGLL